MTATAMELPARRRAAMVQVILSGYIRERQAYERALKRKRDAWRLSEYAAACADLIGNTNELFALIGATERVS